MIAFGWKRILRDENWLTSKKNNFAAYKNNSAVYENEIAFDKYLSAFGKDLSAVHPQRSRFLAGIGVNFGRICLPIWAEIPLTGRN